MKIGYMNSAIQELLDNETTKRGNLLSFVAAMSDVEYRNMVDSVDKAIRKATGGSETIINPSSDTLLPASLHNQAAVNGIARFVIGAAVEEHYPEAKLFSDFLNLCGHEIHPSLHVQQITHDKYAVVLSIARTTLKKNMSPRRNIDT